MAPELKLGEKHLTHCQAMEDLYSRFLRNGLHNRAGKEIEIEPREAEKSESWLGGRVKHYRSADQRKFLGAQLGIWKLSPEEQEETPFFCWLKYRPMIQHFLLSPTVIFQEII